MVLKGKEPKYKRVLIKMSGEALVGDEHDAISPHIVDSIVTSISELHTLGVQLAIVVGGGNFFRGAALSQIGISRITGDYMGMLATQMNALALRDAFERHGLPVRVLSAIPMSGIVDHFNCRKAIHHLERGRILIFSGGTGNPLVTTDSAASLRGIEIDADIIIKATNVDGIYSEDPRENSDAQRYSNLSYKTALEKELAVMDLAAFTQCRDYNKVLNVCNLKKQGALLRVIMGELEGTFVNNK